MPPEPPPRSVTIYDVAAAAGVSPSTVSRAFSRPNRVSAATAERIRRIAADMGFRIHSSSHAQSIENPSIIAVVVADVTNPFYNEIVEGAESAAAEADFATLLANTQGSGRLEREALERAIPVVEGIVLATTTMADSAIRMIAKQRPTVVLNRGSAMFPASSPTYPAAPGAQRNTLPNWVTTPSPMSARRGSSCRRRSACIHWWRCSPSMTRRVAAWEPVGVHRSAAGRIVCCAERIDPSGARPPARTPVAAETFCTAPGPTAPFAVTAFSVTPARGPAGGSLVRPPAFAPPFRPVGLTTARPRSPLIPSTP